MSTNCIEVKNLTKVFGERKAVNGLSFSVEKGQVFGLLGHNGAGKTTTIEMILGLKKPDEGQAVILNMEAEKHIKEIFEKVGVLLQASAYQAGIRVEEICREYEALYRHPGNYLELLVLKHLYCSPCSPVWILGADTLCSAVMAGLSAILVALTAILFFGYRMEGNILLFIGTWLLTLISMFSIGLLIDGLCRTTKSLNVVTSLVYFPMLLLSGATIPYELLPRGLQAVANVIPLGLGIKLMKGISMGNLPENSLLYLVLLILIAVLCGVIAVLTFRWE